MDDMTHWIVIGIGVITILGGLAAYFRDTSKAMAPIVFAGLGAVLLGVSTVKLNFTPEGGSVEIGPVAAATSSNTEAGKQNAAALAAMSARFDTLQAAIDDLKTQVNTRLAQTNAPPITLQSLDNLRLTRPQFNASIAASTAASVQAVQANTRLQAQLRERTLLVPKP